MTRSQPSLFSKTLSRVRSDGRAMFAALHSGEPGKHGLEE
jgi:hypothetical protein